MAKILGMYGITLRKEKDGLLNKEEYELMFRSLESLEGLEVASSQITAHHFLLTIPQYPFSLFLFYVATIPDANTKWRCKSIGPLYFPGGK